MQTTITFGQIAELWKEDKRNVVKHSTFCAYILIIQSHLLPAFDKSTTISEHEAQQFIFDKLAIGLSRKSVHDILAVLKSIVKYGGKHSLFPTIQWNLVFPTDTERKALPVLSLANHRKLINHLTKAPTPQNIGILLALCTGLRIGEVCALRWDRVDLVRRIITVAGTVGRIYNCEKKATEHYASTPKTRTSNREIPISALLLSALRHVRKQQTGAEYVVGYGSNAKEPRTYRETFSRLLKRLHIPPIVFHGLRHTFATRCIESGCDYKTVSAILGHSNVATTLNLYVHPNIEQKKRCIAKMDKFLRINSD